MPWLSCLNVPVLGATLLGAPPQSDAAPLPLVLHARSFSLFKPIAIFILLFYIFNLQCRHLLTQKLGCSRSSSRVFLNLLTPCDSLKNNTLAWSLTRTDEDERKFPQSQKVGNKDIQAEHTVLATLLQASTSLNQQQSLYSKKHLWIRYITGAWCEPCWSQWLGDRQLISCFCCVWGSWVYQCFPRGRMPVYYRSLFPSIFPTLSVNLRSFGSWLLNHSCEITGAFPLQTARYRSPLKNFLQSRQRRNASITVPELNAINFLPLLLFEFVCACAGH